MLNNRNVDIVTVILLSALIGIHFVWGVSYWYYTLLLLAFFSIKAYGATTLSAQFFIKTKCYGDKNSKAVALTFDDGPLPEFTDRILSILHTYQIKSTFFCIGHRIKRNPEILKRIHEQGHLIGNHSYLHGKMFDLQPVGKMSEELQMTDEVIQQTVGSKPRFFRPPYGVTNPNLAKAITKGNYLTAGWSIRSMDTVIHDQEKLFQRVTKNIKGGDVILFHDFSETTLSLLPRIIEHINKQDLKLVRLDELLNERPYV